MKSKRINMLMAAPALLAMLLPGASTLAAPVQMSVLAPMRIPSNFADEAFKMVWMRTDALVDNGTVKRSYFWGPVPGFSLNEDYAEGPGGKHIVQYFDKSRMEINNPAADKSNTFFVTNGLLTRELISGQMQTGNDKYVTRYPAEIDVASDTDDASATTPTYASFRSVTYDYGNSNKLGQTIVDTINRAGLTGTDTRYANYGVKYAYYEPATKHSIPDVFWNFLNASGPILVDGKQVNARLNDPYFYATGFPIADAYWANVKIAGVSNTAVLIQPYERRVLTYVPSAPEGWKVQMGNIGQHYYDWRYQDAGKPPPPQRQCQTVPIRGFGKVWAENSEVKEWLGCTYETERAVTVAHQSFQHGEMLDIIQTYGYGSDVYKVIYVLFDDNTVQRFQDTYVDSGPEPEIVPPGNLYAPKRGFGKVWREGTGARVRERLGWATAPETAVVAPSGGATQMFERGMIVYAGPQLKKIYVLYNNNGYGYYDITRWAVYDDTYSEP